MRDWTRGIVAIVAISIILLLVMYEYSTDPRVVTDAMPAPEPGTVAWPRQMADDARVLESSPESELSPRQCALSGLLLQPDGQPAVGATVKYTLRASAPPPVENAEKYEPATDPEPVRTDAEGRFLLSELPLGKVAVSARHATGSAVARVEFTADRPQRELSLVLRGGLPLAGLVVDRAGIGIVGARVVPVDSDGRSLPEYGSEARATVADGEGGFRLENLEPGKWTLHVSAEGFGAVITVPLAAGIENARVVLSQGVPVACRVLRLQDESPVADIFVTMAYDNYNVAPARAQSDSNGAAVFPSVGAGDYLLDVDGTRYALAGPPLAVTVDPARKMEPITLHVTEGAGIQGRLLDGNTGAGIPGIVLFALQQGRKHPFVAQATNDSGAYAIVGLPPGTYTVNLPFRMPRYPQDPLNRLQETVSLSPGQMVGGVDFTLSAGAVLAGIVLDTAGEPVTGAAVRANAAEGRQNLAEYFTGDDGRFYFGDYGEGEAAYLVAETEAAQSSRSGPFIAGAPGSDNITLRVDLDCTGIVAGRVVDQRNRPFACKIIAVAQDDSLRFPALLQDAETDGLGNFVFTGVCAGTYALELVPRSNARQAGQTVTVKPGQRLHGLTLTYSQGDLLELSGTVVDMDGNPIPKASVSTAFVNGQNHFPGSSAQADESGAFTFTGLPDGDYSVSARAHGFAWSIDAAARAGDSGIVVQMVRAPWVSGHVTDAGGAPVTAYALLLIPQGLPDSSVLRQSVSGERGEFATTLPDSGVWTLRVEASGYAPEELELGHMVPEEGTDNIAVTLQRAP